MNECDKAPCDDLRKHIEGDKDVDKNTIEFAGAEYGWNIRGCCHQCWVVQEITYCPFCGKRLPVEGFIKE